MTQHSRSFLSFMPEVGVIGAPMRLARAISMIARGSDAPGSGDGVSRS